MRTFPVPEPITLVDPATGKAVQESVPGGAVARADWTFKRWALVMLNDPRARGETVEATARLFAVLLPALSAETSVALEDADYDRLAPIVKAPPVIYSGPLMDAQLYPFAEAFLGAAKS